MNVDKRYCQNRARKKKRNMKHITEQIESGDVEEERQFKLKRFVQDVNKFVKGKYIDEKPLTIDKSKLSIPKNHHYKKVQPGGRVVKRDSFQHGLQTKVYCRDMLAKERQVRLDDNLQQIIALSDNSDNKCHYPSEKNSKFLVEDDIIPTSHPVPTLTLWSSATSTSRKSGKSPVSSTTVLTTCNRESARNNLSVTSPQNEFDSELFSEFIRNITISTSKSLSTQFGSKSYSSDVKKKLLSMFVTEGQGNSQETSKLKISVGTSPLSEPIAGSENAFSEINFVPEPTMDTHKFLEETIGPASSSHILSPSPDLQQSHQLSLYHYQDHQLSPPYLQDEPKRHKYSHEPLPSFFSTVSPSFHLGSMTFDGGGDRSCFKPLNSFNPLNSFSPSADEESPVFQYFPRRMF